MLFGDRPALETLSRLQHETHSRKQGGFQFFTMARVQLASGLFVNVKASLVIQPVFQCFSMMYIIRMTSPRNLLGPLAQQS